jgi:hypothetical protein
MIAFRLIKASYLTVLKDICLWTGLLCRLGMLPGPGYIPHSAFLQILQGEIAIKSGTDAVPGQDRNVYTWFDHPIQRWKDLF